MLLDSSNSVDYTLMSHVQYQPISEKHCSENCQTSSYTANPEMLPVNNMYHLTNNNDCKNIKPESKRVPNAERQKDQIKKKKKKPKRIRQRDFCCFCKSLVLNFSRHLQRSHSTESRVQRILSTPSNTTERKDLLTALRKKGNYLWAVDNKCKRPVRKPTALSNTSHVLCKFCLGFYMDKQLWRHEKKCRQKSGNVLLSQCVLQLIEPLNMYMYVYVYVHEYTIVDTYALFFY